jgi:hypothetical protein
MGFIRERGLTLSVRGARSESNPYFFCIHLSSYNSYQLSITDTRLSIVSLYRFIINNKVGFKVRCCLLRLPSRLCGFCSNCLKCVRQDYVLRSDFLPCLLPRFCLAHAAVAIRKTFSKQRGVGGGGSKWFASKQRGVGGGGSQWFSLKEENKSALNGLTTLLPFQDVTRPKAVGHSCGPLVDLARLLTESPCVTTTEVLDIRQLVQFLFWFN